MNGTEKHVNPRDAEKQGRSDFQTVPQRNFDFIAETTEKVPETNVIDKPKYVK